MSFIKKKVKHSLKWKKDAKYCSEKIGISIAEYKKLKKEVLTELKIQKKLKKSVESNVNLENGTAKLAINSAYEPKTADEIIALLKIDTTKWKLSQYWNKQMADHWRVSALVTKLKDEESYFEELLDSWKPKPIKISTVKLNDKTKPHVCGVMSLQDIHFGKEGNETIDKDFEDAVKDLVLRGSSSHYIDNLFFVIGGDLINMDTFNGTTTSGTPVDNSTSATNAYIQAFDAMVWAINFIKAYCNTLTIVYIPGNHDRLSSFHLVHALSKAVDSDEIVWDIEYAERKVHVWGENFNAFEHGDSYSKNTPLIYATEFPTEWGTTRHRTLFTGHYHTNKKVEYITSNESVGFMHKTLPSLSKTDYWHYHKKFVGNKRSGKLELQSMNKGNICELTCILD